MSDAPVLAGINRVVDVANAGDFEKKHTPHIECVREDGKLAVTVTVGHGVPHPNQADHFIEWIEVRAADAPVARFDLAAVVTEPKVTCLLNVDPGTTITALESCNLHGLWEGTALAP